MKLKQKIALLLCSIMFIQPLCVTAEEAPTPQAEDSDTSSQAGFKRRRVNGAEDVWHVRGVDLSYGGILATTYGVDHLEDSTGKWLTKRYLNIRPISASQGLYRYVEPIGNHSSVDGVFRLKDGQVEILEDAFAENYSYRGVDAGEASFYYSLYAPGEYYDLNGNPIEDLGVYLKPYGISLERDKWADEAVKEMTEYGLMPPDLAYNYRSNITRREYCELAFYLYMYEMFLRNGRDYLEEIPLRDSEDFYVTMAADFGIIQGTGNGDYEPDRPITRQEAAVLLSNLVKVINNSPTYREGVKLPELRKVATFADDSAIAPWAKASVYEICGTSSQNSGTIMAGTGNNKFSPTDYYTREQAVVTIYRLLGYFEEVIK